MKVLVSSRGTTDGGRGEYGVSIFVQTLYMAYFERKLITDVDIFNNSNLSNSR